MKTIKALFLALFTASLLGLSSCGPDEVPEPKTYPPYPAIVNTLLFEEGSWWAFEDSATLKKDTFIVSLVSFGYQNAYEGSKLVYTSFEYSAKLNQTSTGRKFSIQYSSRDNTNHNNVYTPLVTLKAYSVIFPPDGYIGSGYEHILFNTTIGDTMNGGYAIINTGHISSRFVLQEKGIGINLFGNTYNEPYYQMKFLNSVAYDRKDLELLLIENVGFGHHTIEGNYYLVNHNAKNIIP